MSTLNSFCVVQYGSSNTWSHVKLRKVMHRRFSPNELNGGGIHVHCLCGHTLTLLLLYTLSCAIMSIFCCIVSFVQNSVGFFFSLFFFSLGFTHNLPFRSFNLQVWVRTLFVFPHLRICDRMCVCVVSLFRGANAIFLQVSKIMMLVEIEVNLL